MLKLEMIKRLAYTWDMRTLVIIFGSVLSHFVSYNISILLFTTTTLSM